MSTGPGWEPEEKACESGCPKRRAGHGTAMKRSNYLTFFSLLAGAILLAAATHTAMAAKGAGKIQLAMAFDDLSGDAIQSDGLGSYDAREGNQGTRVVRTGTRTIHFDFSSPLTWWSVSPFGYGTDSGDIDNVTLTVTLIDSSSGMVVFEFSGEDPDSGGTTDFRLTMSVAISVSGDAWFLEATSDADLQYLWQSSGPRGHGHLYPPSWESAGIFAMPWGAVIEPQQ